MKAFITASIDEKNLARLKRHMDVHIEDWKITKNIFFDGEAFAKRLQEEACDVLIVEADLVQKEVLEGCGLKMVGACRGDPVNVDVELATKLGVPVFYTPARNAEAVADLTLCFMLMIARNVYPAISFVKGNRDKLDNKDDYLKMYQSMTGVELYGRTVGIVGFGAIGQRVAQRVRPFGSRIIAYDPFVEDSVYTELGAEKADLETVMSEADFLTIHVPDIPETKGMIGAREIALLKQGVYFVNTGRAATVEEDPLYEACASGKIQAAAFDVFWKEPVEPDNRFVVLPNVIATPHIGGASHDVVTHQSAIMCDCIEAWLEKRRPRFLANPEVFPGES